MLTRLSILASLEALEENQAAIAIQRHRQRKQRALVGLYWCDFLATKGNWARVSDTFKSIA
jgi:hypothetical protein